MKIIDIQNIENINIAIEECVKTLVKGELIVYPTDTIYGIGCDIDNESALSKIAFIKKREKIQPYLILIDSYEKLREYAEIDETSIKFLKKYWPGPLTVLLKSRKTLSKYIIGESGIIGIRMPGNDFCLKLIKKYGKPITSTSANIHKISQSDFRSITTTFKKDITLFIYEGEVKSETPSTLIDISSGNHKILRQGILKITL